ncbi:FG-GAP-like repeat-containing protein [Candidatus Brocadia sinica]|nr:FG-GAP-like repeat-containing protein [Candidatus Brocadia sinica]
MKKFTLLAVTLMLSLIFNFIVESKVNGEAPGTPANLEATAGSGMVNLSWDSVAGATDYNIYFSRHPGINKSHWRDLAGMRISRNTSPYQLTGLNNGTTYYFVVTAKNLSGESLSSTEVSAIPSTSLVSPVQFNDISVISGLEQTTKQAFGNPLLGDINNDGNLDIVDPHHGGSPSLYQNKGDETFTNIINSSGINTDYIDRHGYGLGDYDNDGNLDLFIGINIHGDQLWKGDGTGKFTNVTNETGIDKISPHARAISLADYDNDGYLDLFESFEGSAGVGVVYKNDKGSYFHDVTDSIGLANSFNIVQSVADYDNDGDMDYFSGGYGKDKLYRNNGNGTYSLNSSFIVKNENVLCRGVAWGDYNNDGFVDLYVSRGNNDYHETLFWDQTKIVFSFTKFTDPGEVTFRCDSGSTITFDLLIGNRLKPASVYIGSEKRNPSQIPFNLSSDEVTGTPVINTGQEDAFFVWKEDTDNVWHIQWTEATNAIGPGFWGHIVSDGNFSQVKTNSLTLLTNYKSTLYRNNGDGSFTDVTEESRTGHIGNNGGAAWGDFDNDGYLDLYVVDASDILGNRTNTLYRNLGDGTFEDITETAGVGAADAVGRHYGASWGDLNNDGNLDLFLSNGFGWGFPLSNGKAILYKNPGNGNNWIKIKLVGTKSNRSGIGARVVLNTSQGIQTRQLNGNGGEVYSQGVSPLHFGLGNISVVDTINIFWPSGAVQTLSQISANQELTTVETNINDSMVAHYPFDEGAGAIATDASGNGNDGAVNGAAWTTGKSGNGLSFDGINDYVSISRMNHEEISIAAWFYKNANDATGVDAIFGGYGWNPSLQLREGFDVRFYKTAPDTLQFILVTQDGSGNKTQKTAIKDLVNSVGGWYHVVGTYNKATGKQMLYVNGQLANTRTHPAGNTVVPLTLYSNMRIGHTGFNGYFNGTIDDVRIYKRALTDQEVQDLYNAL